MYPNLADFNEFNERNSIIGTSEIGSVKICTAKIGTAEIGTAKTCTSELREKMGKNFASVLLCP